MAKKYEVSWNRWELLKDCFADDVGAEEIAKFYNLPVELIEYVESEYNKNNKAINGL
jgi:hypothetical protein